jgi:hypothetical protein
MQPGFLIRPIIREGIPGMIAGRSPVSFGPDRRVEMTRLMFLPFNTRKIPEFVPLTHVHRWGIFCGAFVQKNMFLSGISVT